jgi:MSHA pilin protein MshA
VASSGPLFQVESAPSEAIEESPDMNKLQQGFTLIELVVVITILGILAAFAIPRFANLDDSARVSAVTALAGSLHSAAALAHSQYLAAGNTPSAVTMDGQVVTLANGYPDVAGIQATLQDTTGFTAAPAASAVTYTVNGSPNPAACAVTYVPAAALGTQPVISGPATLAGPTTTGC